MYIVLVFLLIISKRGCFFIYIFVVVVIEWNLNAKTRYESVIVLGEGGCKYSRGEPFNSQTLSHFVL